MLIRKIPTILYVDYSRHLGIDRRRLDGLRRYAATRKWRVETLEHRDCSPAALREALLRLRPIGCAAECWCPETAPRPSLFGRTPVVYFEPPDGPRWRGAHGISCDNAAVGRMAFKELSATRPPTYAVVSCVRNRRWARERMETFLECCRKAGADCDVGNFPFEREDEFDACVSRMVPWVAALPQRCAVFAVNDLYALAAANAMAAAGRSFPRSLTLIGADGTDPPFWDRELAETISTVRLDFELGGYLAAKALGAFAANDAAPLAQMTTRAPRGMMTAACAANDGTPCGRNNDISSLPPKAATSLLAAPASSLRAKPAPSLVFPPLLVDRRKSTRGYGRREPRILEAMETIRREACEGLTAETLAKRFRGSRQHFALRFKEAAGHTVLDEIINVRIARAIELLAHSDMPIAAVANFCGFRTELAFWKIFSKRMGVAPLLFRKARK